VSIDVTDQTFETAVIARSEDHPVVVDLWAPWCGPCRTLGPILEDVIGKTEGAVELVKVNVDENPQVAAAFQIQSIPAVYALRDGKVVDGFIGALPESSVTEFVSRLVPIASEADLLVEEGDEGSLRAALEIEADHPVGVVKLAEILVGRGETDEALALLARVPESAETRRVAALARLGLTAPATDTDDLDARFDALLGRVRTDDGARQEYVDLLETLEADDPRRLTYRKALSTRLF
jgi:putative thioredoxin